MAKTIPALEARTHLGEIMKKAYLGKEKFIVEKGGIPLVAIISVDEFINLTESRKKRFEVYSKIQERGKKYRLKEIEKDIEEALKAVRGK